MKFSINLRIIFFIPLFLTVTPTSSQFHIHSEYCLEDVGNYTTDSTYHENLIDLLPNLINKASLSTFDNITVGQGIDQTYGLYMCRGDLNGQQCHDCVEAASKTIVEKCPTQKEAIMWYQECMVRYANRPIYSHQEQSQMSYTWSLVNVSDPTKFGKLISEMMDGLIEQAAYNSSRGYATDQGELTLFENVYAFAQCTPDIIGNRCERCLRVAFRNMGACCGTARVSMEMYLPSCWLRYDQAPFIGEFNNENDAPSTSTTSSTSGPPTMDFNFPNNTPVVPPSPPSGSNQLTSLKTYLLVMTLCISSLFMAW
ncbi:putative cysteine-rich receptor-like protein kinase 9 [Chenopodium quinoa]|uniref:putative cysteine-rich receptor-like protein kinase 9 n=1 Tax=Chenopodium quinoa TaxID=63459 RepID=UPI000B7763BF|nr:putative cysteine-rich receptor-like protein kinase 9 [Chenopodium quinoa]